FRLADLYLLYAEALNETMSAPNAEVYDYIDKIRDRAGLKGVAESWSNYSIFPQKHTTREGMREIIHRERGIELAFESQRYYDIRRWKKSLEHFDGFRQGWNVNGALPEDFYQVKAFRNIDYNLKDIF